MSLVEILFRPISYFFLIPTIVLLLVLMNNFVEMTPELTSIFDDICSNPSQYLPILTDYRVSEGNFFVQFIVPYDNFVLDKKYYQSYLDIINHYSDENLLIKDVDISNEDKVTRQNYGLLRQCSESACFCLVESGTSQFKLNTYKELLCLSNIFSYNMAKVEFKTKFNAIKNDGLTDYELLNRTVNHTLFSIKNDYSPEATRIKNCYNLLNKINISYSEYPAFSILNYKTPNFDKTSNNYDILKEFYELTDAGILFKIKSCSTIPNEDACIHTKDIKSNFIIVNASDSPSNPITSGPLLFYSPKDYKVNMIAKVINLKNIVEINIDNAVGICSGDINFNCKYFSNAPYFCSNKICDSTTLCESKSSVSEGKYCDKKSDNTCSSIKSKVECEKNLCAGCVWLE